ncbi:PfkB family kinase [Aspergillus luchuensis]|uniref:PfkB family kinase n=1 Tax=Aspergillus kawachii TaxID=1069201 RepID=A0A146FQD6_ASPKA|nr:PfkB family kinase [Aspergillus luchuensis]
MSLVAIGACYVDTILTTPHYPGEDDKLRASSISRRRGGNCPNSLEVLKQLTTNDPSTTDVSLNLIAVLPAKTSTAAQEIQSAFKPHVDLSHCIFREAFNEPASSYIIKSELSGSRTIVNYNELPEMTVDEFTQIAGNLTNPTWFHFEGRIPDVTLSCIRYLRQRYPSATISVEVEKPGREGLQKLAEEADVVFYSKSWAQVRAPLIKNPIGAGDTFIAGMLYALIYRGSEWSLSEKLGFANRLAGMKVSQEGFSGLARALESFP